MLACGLASVRTQVGREQSAYLHHVLARYKSLPARTVFMHGREPSCGWSTDLLSGNTNGHLMHQVRRL